MVTYYCPKCWAEIGADTTVCPHCGYLMTDFKKLSYEEKLLLTLKHPILDNRMIAVQSLGNLGSQQALPMFAEILADLDADVFVLREVLEALAKIDHPQSRELLKEALNHPFPVIRHKAEELVKRSSTLNIHHQ
jgi:HEAT repeat protein